MSYLFVTPCKEQNLENNKREDSNIQAMEMKFLRAILNRTKKEKIRNANIRLELDVDEIKNGIQKNILTLFGHVMRMRVERIFKKMLQTKMEGKD